MDSQSGLSLARLIRTQRIAALGTISGGAPLVSMVQYVSSRDFSSFYIHVSRLAQHTQSILLDQRVSLMIMEPDSGEDDPQTLARISIRGDAVEMLATEADYEEAKSAYLAKYPMSAFNFGLGDFILYCIRPRNARYIGGFGNIIDLESEDFKQIASITN